MPESRERYALKTIGVISAAYGLQVVLKKVIDSGVVSVDLSKAISGGEADE